MGSQRGVLELMTVGQSLYQYCALVLKTRIDRQRQCGRILDRCHDGNSDDDSASKFIVFYAL